MSVNLFGRTYTSNGTTDSDYLIKTKGKVKIQCGSKFIDLIKDGKLNVNSEFIYLQDTVGNKDGIYVSNDGDVVLVIKGKEIPLTDSENTYVSFLSEQETTPDQKYQALKNIGFIQETLDTTNIVQNGIVFVKDSGKLYIVKDGVVSEFTAEFPTTLNGQFTINNDTSNKGSLIITGSGDTNSIYFDSFTIYNDENGGVLNANSQLYLKIDNNNIITLNNSGVDVNGNLTADTIQVKNTSIGSIEIDGLLVAGIASPNGVFDTLQYSSESTLDKDDDSLKVASTAWVNDKLEEVTGNFAKIDNEGNILLKQGKALIEETSGLTLIKAGDSVSVGDSSTSLLLESSTRPTWNNETLATQSDLLTAVKTDPNLDSILTNVKDLEQNTANVNITFSQFVNNSENNILVEGDPIVKTIEAAEEITEESIGKAGVMTAQDKTDLENIKRTLEWQSV